ncbi:hypothetical protein [Roseateles sp. PN1]|uniref:hypothetical protein n=1 Tax=Roseateles sp. PN1 TaxID=3137372 RepID=UPI003138676A
MLQTLRVDSSTVGLESAAKPAGLSKSLQLPSESGVGFDGSVELQCAFVDQNEAVVETRSRA